MEVVNTQLMNIGLNVLGYLVAALLGMVIYSAFQKRRSPAVPATVTPTGPQASESPAASADKPAGARSDFEFVDLRQASTPETSTDPEPKEPPSRPGSNRRDRPEIIRLAREMVKAGTPREMIKRTLPISDVELALLQTGNNK